MRRIAFGDRCRGSCSVGPLLFHRVMSSVAAKVDDFLLATRNECVLQGGLVRKLKEYLVDTLEVSEVPRDLPDTVEEWVATAQDAFGDDTTLPAVFEARLKRWLAGGTTPRSGTGPHGGLSPSHGLGADGGATPGPFTLLAAELGTTAGAIQDDFDELSITTHTRDKAISDMKAQGMLPTRTFALSLSLETGRVHPASELSGMTYGCDVRATTLVKDLRKAKIPLLSTALEAGKMATVNSHLNGLLRDLAAHGKMHEAALLSGWMQEWGQMFQGEDALAIAYLVEYFRVFPGRGLPTPFDYGIMFRVQKSAGAGSGASEVKELAKEVKTLKNTLNNVQEQCASLKKKGEDLKRQVEAMGRRPGPGGPAAAANVICHICGKKGHFARDCPDKLKDETDEKD